MKKINGVLLGLLLTTAVFAGEKPQMLKFEEGEQLATSLSKVNFNRIFVEGERITKISFPEQTFLIDKSGMDDERDGSIYLKPLVDMPLTIFFTTDENHHFSLTVKSNDALGRTLKLVRKGVKGYDYMVAKLDEQYKTDDAMSELMEGKVPHDFSEINVKPSPFYVHKNLKLTLLKQYRSKTSSAYVYRIENKSKEAIELDSSLFANPKLLSLEFSEHQLKPMQAAYLYGFYRDIQGIG